MEKHVWSGYDSVGRRVQAVKMNENWFCRSYEYNGYGMGWSKWSACDSLTVTPANSVEWGFSKLQYAGVNNRLRLPI